MQISILVDWQNLFKATSGNKRLKIDTVVGEIVAKGLDQGEIHEIRLFVPNYQSVAPWRLLNALQVKYGLEVSVCSVLSNGTSKEILKDLVDFEMFRWVQKNVYSGVGVRKIVLVSGDSHFLLAANEIIRKGKEVEFWFVEGAAGSLLIREQSNFREIKIRPPLFLLKRNVYLELLDRLYRGEPLQEDDKEKLIFLHRLADLTTERTIQLFFSTSEINKAAEALSERLEAPPLEAPPLEKTMEALEALLALGVIRVHPAIKYTISVETDSPLFVWISSLIKEASTGNKS